MSSDSPAASVAILSCKTSSGPAHALWKADRHAAVGDSRGARRKFERVLHARVMRADGERRLAALGASATEWVRSSTAAGKRLASTPAGSRTWLRPNRDLPPGSRPHCPSPGRRHGAVLDAGAPPQRDPSVTELLPVWRKCHLIAQLTAPRGDALAPLHPEYTARDSCRKRLLPAPLATCGILAPCSSLPRGLPGRGR